MNPIKIFVSYSHEDKLYFDILLKGIKKHSRSIDLEWNIWEDRKLPIGEKWNKIIQENVKNCDVAVLMISSNFFYSDYINQHELERFLCRKESDNNFVLFPIYLDPCFYTKAPLISEINIFTTNGDRYGKPTIDDLSYADLVNISSDGVIMPSPMRERYHMDVVQAIQTSIEYGKFVNVCT